jgi:hypothetical protein
MCSGKIAVLSLLVPHKTRGELMCSGKISVLSLLAPHKTGGEFMCSGKIAVLSLLVLHKTEDVSITMFITSVVRRLRLVEKELLSFQNT